MRNSNFLVAITVSAIFIVLLSCARIDRGSARVSFVTKYASIEFSFPPGWQENRDDHPYDLQCSSSSKNMNTGVFVFKRIDLATDSKPIDTFWKQVNDLKSKRGSFEELEALQTLNYDDKTVTSITYLGEKDSSQYCYRFSLIEFKADDSDLRSFFKLHYQASGRKANLYFRKSFDRPGLCATIVNQASNRVRSSVGSILYLSDTHQSTKCCLTFGLWYSLASTYICNPYAAGLPTFSSFLVLPGATTSHPHDLADLEIWGRCSLLGRLGDGSSSRKVFSRHTHHSRSIR
jgi:hypothetical protein